MPRPLPPSPPRRVPITGCSITSEAPLIARGRGAGALRHDLLPPHAHPAEFQQRVSILPQSLLSGAPPLRELGRDHVAKR